MLTFTKIVKMLMVFILMGSLFANTLSLEDNGNGTWNVNYTSDTAIGGFQFNVDGTTINSASGGAAGSAGFMMSASGNLVLGFSLTGATISAGEATLLVFNLAGTPTGLSGITMSDASGIALDFCYGVGCDVVSTCDDMDACNYGAEADC